MARAPLFSFCSQAFGRLLHCSLSPRRSVVSGISAPSSTRLGDIIKLDLLQSRTKDEVANIWTEYHNETSKGIIGGLMSADDYLVFATRAQTSPMFVVPLAKGGGAYHTLLLQCQLPVVLYTSLDAYRRLGPGAPPHMVLTVYNELCASHGLALTRADVVDRQVITPAEARTLAELTRAFYTDHATHQLVYKFNHDPKNFDFHAMLDHLGLAGAAEVGAGAGTGGGGGGGQALR